METNQNKMPIVAVVAVLILIIVGGTFIYSNFAVAPSEKNTADNSPAYASKCGLTIENVAANGEVEFPLNLTGSVNNPEGADCSWIMFEGQAGVATLHYQTKDGWSLPVDTQPIPVAEWMSTSTTFSVTLDFDNSIEQLPSGYEFKVIFTEDDPSGEQTPDTLELPVTLK
jgi:hypothetical protein